MIENTNYFNKASRAAAENGYTKTEFNRTLKEYRAHNAFIRELGATPMSATYLAYKNYTGRLTASQEKYLQIKSEADFRDYTLNTAMKDFFEQRSSSDHYDLMYQAIRQEYANGTIDYKTFIQAIKNIQKVDPTYRRRKQDYYDRRSRR